MSTQALAKRWRRRIPTCACSARAGSRTWADGARAPLVVLGGRAGQFRRVFAGDGPAYSEEMAAWLVTERVHSVRALASFRGAGYRYDAAASRPGRPVFVRAYADRR